MRTFKITKQHNWIIAECGFVDANSHLDAIAQIDKNVMRIFNDRFRKIEKTGQLYYVNDCYSKQGKTFIFESL